MDQASSSCISQHAYLPVLFVLVLILLKPCVRFSDLESSFDQPIRSFISDSFEHTSSFSFSSELSPLISDCASFGTTLGAQQRQDLVKVLHILRRLVKRRQPGRESLHPANHTHLTCDRVVLEHAWPDS
ncbi:target of early activation tagged (EAT) 2 [Striga asiatica]|uniref:Target of early activation tagged (EAT) 2 n=1 Tax=Striga asiatica TaxID=4170 RepID=A0A5A7RHF7_STRAF|nr:target of early activation tagged (EAT) 2 [Striga asiatica]